MALFDTKAVLDAQERRLSFRLRVMRILAKADDKRSVELQNRHGDFALQHSMHTLALLRKVRKQQYSI